MNNFFRSFFAALLALVVFNMIIVVFSLLVIAVISSGQRVDTGRNAVLVIDLSQSYNETEQVDPMAVLRGGGKLSTPPLYDLLRMIRHAKEDAAVRGLYLKCDNNNNGLAVSNEIRDAVLDFKKAGKFVFAYGNVMPQRAYYVATAASKLYCHPAGGIEWHGLTMQMPFITGTLEKLEIDPQVFYAGKYKSSTEIVRLKKMSDANREQTAELLSDLFSSFLGEVARSRNIDTADLRLYADSNKVQFPTEALALKMVDGLRYDDEVKDEIKHELGLDENQDINFISPAKYSSAVNFEEQGSEKVAVIYAEGNIVDGKATRGTIGGDTYRNYIRKARLDETIKAIVLRINSGGGSAMASEVMWREVYLAQQEKPVFVSFGEVAASGGYYMACAADSIFTGANTITGSIGVFSIVPNMQDFLNNKLGVSFDEVSTSPDGAAMSVVKPLSAAQRAFIQQDIDTIYHRFKTRVADGRKISIDYVDSVAQGRIWSGKTAVSLGLADRTGTLSDAIRGAAAKAGLADFRVVEFPGTPDILEMFFGSDNGNLTEEVIKEEVGNGFYQTFTSIREIRNMIGKTQARLPFNPVIQ